MLARVHDSEIDSGPKRGGAATQRYCIAARAAKPIGELIRFVIGPDGELVPDLKGKLPGRGVWLTGTRATLAEAVKRKAFSRAFRREVRLASEFVAMTERLLEGAAIDALAIAGKAGLVVTGFSKVEAALQQDDVKGLLHASDAAPDGVKKTNATLRKRFGGEGDQIPVIDAYSGAQLDLALGRANVIHAALLAGPETAIFLARNQRLERFRTGDSGDAGDRSTPRN